MRRLFPFLLALCACREARDPSDRKLPSSGVYAVTETKLRDDCHHDTRPVERQVFVRTGTAPNGKLRASLPLSLDGEPALVSMTTIDEAKPVTLVESPAPFCRGAKRVRELAIADVGHDAFELAVVERWSIPHAGDCQLTPDLPATSCETVRRFSARVVAQRTITNVP